MVPRDQRGNAMAQGQGKNIGLKVAEVAEMVGVSGQTIYKALQMGVLVRMSTQQVKTTRISKKDAQWLAARWREYENLLSIPVAEVLAYYKKRHIRRYSEIKRAVVQSRENAKEVEVLPEEPKKAKTPTREVKTAPKKAKTPTREVKTPPQEVEIYPQEAAKILRATEIEAKVARSEPGEEYVHLNVKIHRSALSSLSPPVDLHADGVLEKLRPSLSFIERRTSQLEKRLEHYRSENSKMQDEMRGLHDRLTILEEALGDEDRRIQGVLHKKWQQLLEPLAT